MDSDNDPTVLSALGTKLREVVVGAWAWQLLRVLSNE